MGKVSNTQHACDRAKVWKHDKTLDGKRRWEWKDEYVRKSTDTADTIRAKAEAIAKAMGFLK